MTFNDDLQASLCSAFSVRPDGAERWAIATPFLFEDGDALPAFVCLDEQGWFLTDDGMSVSHLFFDDFAYTEARFRSLTQLVTHAHAEMTPEHEVRMRLDGSPSAFDVGDFLQLVAQIRGVAITAQVDRDQTRFVQTLRHDVERRLRTPDFDENWSPPQLDDVRARYRADLRISTSEAKNVVLFAASTTDKANVSALTIGRFARVRSDLVPVLAYHPDKVGSEAVFRFQDEVGDDSVAVATMPGESFALAAALRERGVDIAT